MLTLLKLSATWCSPCSALSETLSKILPDYPNIKLIEVDIDEDAEAARNYKVRSIPTLILLEDGKEVDRLVGNHPKEKVKKFLER